MRLFRRIRLFLELVFRECEDKKCGIPDPYRAKARIMPRLAWEVAGIIHPAKENNQAVMEGDYKNAE